MLVVWWGLVRMKADFHRCGEVFRLGVALNSRLMVWFIAQPDQTSLLPTLGCKAREAIGEPKLRQPRLF
jgi:hypothetical protein